jgi:hypothetical protein
LGAAQVALELLWWTIKTFATRSEYSNNLRNEVEYLTELRFTAPQLFL